MMSYENEQAFHLSLEAAQKLIKQSNSIGKLMPHQKAALAVAYYTLAIQEELPARKAKMHINAAISLLRGIKIKSANEQTQMALAYLKRSELAEMGEHYRHALEDYLRAFELFHYAEAHDFHFRSLIAQSCISIADILLHHPVNTEGLELRHPLFYVNHAVTELNTIEDPDEDTSATLAFAHQMAGIILTPEHSKQAFDAFEVALRLVGHTDEETAFPLLSDLYNCLGLLFQSKILNPLTLHLAVNAEWDAFVYYGLALLFSEQDFEDFEYEEDLFGYESLLELIQRVLEPEMPFISKRTYCHLIDGLLYAHYGVMQATLPNEIIRTQLQEGPNLGCYVLLIHELLTEYHQRYHQQMTRLLHLVPTQVRARMPNHPRKEKKAKVLYLAPRLKPKT